MDATCKVQDNIHVFRLVHNMCPGFWVHINIKKVFFDKKIILEKYKKKISDDTPFELDASKFGPREDYVYWQNKEILNGN